MAEIAFIDNICRSGQEISDSMAVEVSDLISNSFSTSHEGEYTPEQAAKVEQMQEVSPDILKSRIVSGCLVYATNGGEEVVGCVLISPRGGAYQLSGLHVKRTHQGKGIGTQILNATEQKLRDLGTSAMFIDANRFKKTIDFYKARGFKEVNLERAGDILVRRGLATRHPELYITMAKYI